jgi:hypothetical protein
VVLAVNDVIKPWIETGEPIRDGGPMGTLTKALQRIARALADAEDRGRAAERADVMADLHRCAAKLRENATRARNAGEFAAELSDRANFADRLASEYERGEHVGAAAHEQPPD